jgi:DNA sulfur modification protein DndD
VIFESLTLQNFGPYYGHHSLNLRPEGDRSIILIGGLNGGGKTTLMDALRLALYGQRAQIDRRRSLADADFLAQCVNTHAAPTDSAAVELTFERVIYISVIEKLSQVRVRRTW